MLGGQTITAQQVAHMSATHLSPLAEQLFSAQVQYFVARVSPTQFAKVVGAEVDDFFAEASSHTLKDYLPEEHVRYLALHYATSIPLSPNLAETLSDLVLRAYHHPKLDALTWGDLLDKQELGEFVDLALSLNAVRKLIRRFTRNRLVVNAVSDLVYRGITGFMGQSTAKAEQMASTIPGAGSMFKIGRSVVGRATSGFEKSAEENIKRYLSHNIRAIIKGSEARLEQAIESGALRNAILNNWDNVKSEKVASVRSYASEQDIKDALNSGVGFWQSFRQTPYVEEITNLCITLLYEYCADTPIATLLDELGISANFITTEINTAIAPVLEQWLQQGWVEAFFARQLLPFWQQADTEGWLVNNA